MTALSYASSVAVYLAATQSIHNYLRSHDDKAAMSRYKFIEWRTYVPYVVLVHETLGESMATRLAQVCHIFRLFLFPFPFSFLFPFPHFHVFQLPNATLPKCIIGARCARPTLVVKTRICLSLYIYMYIHMFGTCVFRIYIHPVPFVRDAIFPHCMLVHVATVAQETRLAGQEG